MDQHSWDLLLARLDTIEANQRVSAKKQDKLLEFRGWVLGAGFMAGCLGGFLINLLTKGQ